MKLFKMYYDAQQVFDIAVGGVISQGGQSIVGLSSCMYRGPDGKKCAGGHLIPDDEYDASLEGRPWAFVQSKFPEIYEHRDLIGQLQVAHDTIQIGHDSKDWTMEKFINKCKEIAMTYKLEWKF